MRKKSKKLLTIFSIDSLVEKGVDTCSLFALYNGHGGDDCSQFLKENLHKRILEGLDPRDVQDSLEQVCLQTDREFYRQVLQGKFADLSGASSLVFLTIGKS
jgi:serine/threonine protein phosphatase PrpC